MKAPSFKEAENIIDRYLEFIEKVANKKQIKSFDEEFNPIKNPKFRNLFNRIKKDNLLLVKKLFERNK